MQGTRKRSHTRMFVLLRSMLGYGRPSGTLHFILEPYVMIKPIGFEVTALMGI